MFFSAVSLAAGQCFCLSALWWRHNDHDSVSNHQPHECLPNRLFRRRSKKTSKLRVTGLCVGNSPGPVNAPHKGPVTRKMFPFDDVIMASNMILQNVYKTIQYQTITNLGKILQCGHNERDCVSNHRSLNLLNRSSRCKSKKTSKLHR